MRKTAVLVISLLVVRANGAEPPPADVQALAEQFRETKENLAQNEVEKRRILGSLYSINKRMKKISREKSSLTDELFHVQDNVKGIAKVIANLETQIEAQRLALKRRLRALYKLSGESYVGILFSQNSAYDLDHVMKYLKIVAENDYRLIRSYQMNVAAYKEKKRLLKIQVEKLVGIEKRIKKQENLLVQEHKAKTKVVSELDAKKLSHLTSIAKIRETTQALKSRESNLDEALLSALKPSFFESKGQLQQPVAGQIVQEFGLVQDEKHKIQLSHKGWQYSAPKGSQVTAVFEGTVAHSAWVTGYGHTLVIDHGDHYYSVYGHVSRPKVRIGDQVKKGQTIAEAGSSSRRYGEGIYFEIRHFSEPENPMRWISSKGVRVSSAQAIDFEGEKQ